MWPRELFFQLSLLDVPQVSALSALRKRWIAASFEPRVCQQHLEEALARGVLDSALFSPQEVSAGGRFVTDAFLFPQSSWRLMLAKVPGMEGERHVPLSDGQLEDLVGIPRWAWREGGARSFAALDVLPGLGELAKLDGTSLKGDAPRWREAREPGIFRREHASLLIRSRTTSVLVDPICLATKLPAISRAPLTPAEDVDAICITHGHWDHWHLPSILHHAGERRTLPVLVPEVPRVNALCEVSFEDALAKAGQKSLPAAWDTTVKLGDMEIDVLPFYGEQPTRDAPGPLEGIRSFGNCYRFNTPTFSALLLVDSGADPMGSMLEVAGRSLAQRGPVDVVLACLRTFASPFFGGLPLYFATLPFERLRALFAQYSAGTLPSTTAGPGGMAEICAAVQARWFLPYANGFEGVGRPITDIGWGQGEPSESASVGELRRALEEVGAPTELRLWNPGDAATWPSPGSLRVVPA